MATRKDLVEAYSFGRRRLVAAFVSGAAGGREMEPRRPGRPIAGGLALAVLLLTGSAVAGMLGTTVDPAWAERPGLVVSEEEGVAYVITEAASEPVLHPVLNITSARLILGNDPEPRVIPESSIAQERIGSELGIPGAPADVPEVEHLISGGWTGCASGRRLRLSVTHEQVGVPAPPNAGMLVRVDDRYYLVAVGRRERDGRATARSYVVPDSAGRESMLRHLGLELFDAKPVSQRWLDLLPRGAPLDRSGFGLDPEARALDVPEAGGPVPVGSVVTAPDGTSFLASQDGLEVLDPFARTVYRDSGEVTGDAPEIALGDAPANTGNRPGYHEAGWPTDVLTGVFGEACVRLLAEAGTTPRVEVVQDPTVEASADSSVRVSVEVEAGHGAFVLAGGWEKARSGRPFVIDAGGRAHPFGGLPDATRVGYGSYHPPVVPSSWIEVYERGVELSTEAATTRRCAPVTSCT